ncbi:MAG: SGNH/GDSL hydrolase family protein [Thermotogota bacterium]|nr:SGNH/GDSL hydrolase family protein [Thermotogota bacterium]
MDEKLKNGLANLGLVVVSVVVFLIIVEGVLTFASPEEIIPIRPEGLYQSDLAVGYIPAPFYEGRVRTSEFDYSIKINSQSMRDVEHTINKQRDIKRILGLGDSFTFGCSVDYEYAYLTQLEKKLNNNGTKIEIIKAGVGGYGTDNEYYYLVNYGSKYKPDIVLVGFFAGNDVRDTMLGFYKYNTANGVTKWNETILRSHGVIKNTEKNEAFSVFKSTALTLFPHSTRFFYGKYKIIKNKFFGLGEGSQISNSQTNLTILNYETFYKKKYSDDVERGWNETFDFLMRIKKLTEANNATLVVVIIPVSEQVHKEDWGLRKMEYGLNENDFDLEKPQKKLIRFCEGNDVYYIDLLPKFKEKSMNGDRLYYESDVHWNEKGHELAADIIAESLLKKNLLKTKVMNNG